MPPEENPFPCSRKFHSPARFSFRSAYVLLSPSTLSIHVARCLLTSERMLQNLHRFFPFRPPTHSPGTFTVRMDTLNLKAVVNASQESGREKFSRASTRINLKQPKLPFDKILTAIYFTLGGKNSSAGFGEALKSERSKKVS